ncbi:MAG: M50 family metallopeptidase [Clostridium sp.]|uniref:metalloprotease n=1 Tax=Clostridium sp. DSM 8431 TaxID=1761781 RepID=UPI0008F01B25|nr:M50 family metallopeptidase [Clostridium sp. DSM 8431]MCR4943511.1 M50 family metallopeptidase [Clostridium sp.]SFU64267.1 putative peptide zinc metalloprotease protein [Clostridium sp. DSM 8431]
MKYGDIEVLASEKGSFIVKGRKKYVRLGENELRYLFKVRGIKTKDFEFSNNYEISNESKAILDEKFKEWGFLSQGDNEEKSNSKIDISMIHLVTINPDKFLDKIYPIGKIFFSKVFLGIYIVANFILTMLIGINAESVLYDLENMNYTSSSIAIIFIAMLLTVMLHELGHAFVCKKYGGKVSKMGLVLFFLLPCLFCDVSDIYLMKKKKEKVFVSIAGLYVNSMLATLSLLVYFIIGSDTNISSYLLLYYISNMGFIVYNLIPFVKLDGYWLLSACININNLLTKSVISAIASIFNIKLVINASAPIIKKVFLVIYGWAVLLFRPIFWYFSIAEIYSISNSIMSDTSFKIVIILVSLIAVLDIMKFVFKYIKLFKKDRQQIFNFL